MLCVWILHLENLINCRIFKKYYLLILFYHFQEVDKFDELAEDLKLKGYRGIWKVG